MSCGLADKVLWKCLEALAIVLFETLDATTITQTFEYKSRGTSLILPSAGLSQLTVIHAT
jgi:hypothetical protein